MTASNPQYPLYNSTYSAYRLSPLYIGDAAPLDSDTLLSNARRLRDVLQGSTLRGVDVGLGSGDGGLKNTGALESCTWDLIGDEDSWEAIHRAMNDAEADGSHSNVPRVSVKKARGVHVKLQYQKATYRALLLRDPNHDSVDQTTGFLSLPLLLVRMPSSLRYTFLEHLTTTFDARISPLKLRSSFLSVSFESLLAHLGASEHDIPATVKTVQVQLSFAQLSATDGHPLRNIDITLAREDIPLFVANGEELLAQDPEIVGKAQTAKASSITISGPFTAALSHYLSGHLALSLDNPLVEMSKIACGAFALAGDGKIKIFPPAAGTSEDSSEIESPTKAALDELYSSLVREATGASLEDFAKHDEPLASVASKGKGKGKRALEATSANSDRTPGRRKRKGRAETAPDDGDVAVPTSPPPPYELHAPPIDLARR